MMTTFWTDRTRLRLLRKRAVVAQKAREILEYKPSVYKCFYDSSRAIFIHIPKCAGTTISHTLYGRSTWHWTAADLRFINSEKFDAYFKFSVIRNPWSRLYSTYLYAPRDCDKFPGSPLEFMLKYRTFEDFVNRGLSAEVIRCHYFLTPQYSYLTIKDRCAVDLIGRLEDLDTFMAEIANRLPVLSGVLPRLNATNAPAHLGHIYTAKMIDKVANLYQVDIAKFQYDFPVSQNSENELNADLRTSACTRTVIT